MIGSRKGALVAVDDLTQLRDEMPSIFEDRPLPADWLQDWVKVPIVNPGDPKPTPREAESEPDWVQEDPPQCMPPQIGSLTPPLVTPFLDVPGPAFPGRPRRVRPGRNIPPPDGLAFYLPFHLFPAAYWGIYLFLEGVQRLGDQLVAASGGTLTPVEGTVAARIFLYRHEAFHHRVESFATRLEVTHRRPLYRGKFDEFFRASMVRGDGPEEGLATAYAYRECVGSLFRANLEKRQALAQGLKQYIRGLGPPNSHALEFLKVGAFQSRLNEFAEENQRFCLPALPAVGASVWRVFSHAFTGIGRCNSRVNYLLSRFSSLRDRARFRA